MEARIVEFAELLRHNGLKLSSSEVLDAVRSVELLGVADRDTFRAQPKWSYYMVWAVDTPAPGAPEPDNLGGPHVRALVSDPRMLSLDDPAYRARGRAVATPQGR